MATWDVDFLGPDNATQLEWEFPESKNNFGDSTCTYNTSTATLSNISASQEVNKFESALSPAGDILFGCYLILAEILAVIFNGFVIGISFWKRKSLKPSDTYVVVLAVSDIGHPVVAYPMIIVSSFHHAWIFGDAGCKWNGFTGFFFGVNSMTTLAMMSFSRLLVITTTNFTRNHAHAIARALITFCVLFALFWATSPLLGWGEYGPEPYKTSCTLIWDTPDKSFVTASFIGCLAVPAFIMCYSYGRILFVAFKTRHKRKKWQPRTSESKVWEKKELRLLKMAVLMCTSFMCCWTPYAVLAMIKAYAPHIPLSPTISAIPALAAKTSHVIDPLIYCALNKNFSRLVPRLFGRKRSLDREMTTQSLQFKNPIPFSSGPESPFLLDTTLDTRTTNSTKV